MYDLCGAMCITREMCGGMCMICVELCVSLAKCVELCGRFVEYMEVHMCDDLWSLDAARQCP